MRNRLPWHSGGFSLIEILTVLAIVMIIGALLFEGFASYNKHYALSAATSDIQSFIESARSKTLSSRGDKQYGIYVEPTTLTLFSGAFFTPENPTNRVDTLELHRYVEISAVAFSGGGTQLVFDRLTGATARPGTITVALRSDNTKTAVITISATGLIH